MPDPAVAPAPLTSVTDETLALLVQESDQPVLVDVTADWCPPCRRMHPLIERLAAEHDDLRVVTLDADAHPATVARLGVLSLPTFVLFRNGAPVASRVGARPYGRLVSDVRAAL
jgi:thioredoxin 1